MRKLERWDMLQREAQSLRRRQTSHHPLSQEWMALEMQIAACYQLQEA